MASPTPRPRRASRFTEGAPVTGEEVAQQAPANHDLLRRFLRQQDELEERKRKARSDSSASTESFVAAFRRHTSAAYGGPSPNPNPSPPDAGGPEKHVGRRSIVFGRPSEDGARRSLDERPRVGGPESVATKFKGRLRALTGGRERSGHQPSDPGT
ncbi:hypothetical protein BUE80_DR003426 [Diplocarpon rosae]|nr:hypothetical protein BUE80_DR003426 [Diplocarpon rosae]